MKKIISPHCDNGSWKEEQLHAKVRFVSFQEMSIKLPSNTRKLQVHNGAIILHSRIFAQTISPDCFQALIPREMKKLMWLWILSKLDAIMMLLMILCILWLNQAFLLFRLTFWLPFVKVQVFWEGQKNYQSSICNVEDGPNFCGLLRIPEL